MSFQKEQNGFIFSLDATLGILVVILVMAGVARAGGSALNYGQHGYLLLERYANDALEVLYLTGKVTSDNKFISTIDNIKTLLARGTLADNSLAENIAENTLRSILPLDIQFRLRIGLENNPRLDNVYPSVDNHPAWYGNFTDAEEIAVATRVSLFTPENVFEPITLYVWRGAGI